MVKTAIVEDIKLIREGLTALINGTSDLICVGSYESCEKLLDELEQKQPDVILMDIKLNGMSGIKGIKAVKEINPNVNIIMLTVHEDNKNIFEAFMMGASGYLLKTTPPAQIIDSIIDAHNGDSPMNSSIANKVIDLLRLSQSQKNSDEKVTLSGREIQILSMISNGAGYKKISDELFISTHTVRYHIRNIYKKLQVGSQSEAVAIALRKGLI